MSLFFCVHLICYLESWHCHNEAYFNHNRNGIKQRKNSWQDGVLGTNCPIPPNSNYTYKFQAKDQIGSYTYFPSTLMHRAAGGFGALNIYHRSVIPIPYPNPDGDFTLLLGDWYKTNHKVSLHSFLFAPKRLRFFFQIVNHFPLSLFSLSPDIVLKWETIS